MIIMVFQRQLEEARTFLNVEMGQNARTQSVTEVSINLTADEMQKAKERFRMLDKDNKGHVTLNDLRKHFKV